MKARQSSYVYKSGLDTGFFNKTSGFLKNTGFSKKIQQFRVDLRKSVEQNRPKWPPSSNFSHQPPIVFKLAINFDIKP
jgi:hypothetical protein